VFFLVVFWLDFSFSFPVFSSVGGFGFFLAFVFVLSSVLCFILFWCCVCMRSWFFLSAAGLDGAGVDVFCAFRLCSCGCPVIKF